MYACKLQYLKLILIENSVTHHPCKIAMVDIFLTVLTLVTLHHSFITPVTLITFFFFFTLGKSTSTASSLLTSCLTLSTYLVNYEYISIMVLLTLTSVLSSFHQRHPPWQHLPISFNIIHLDSVYICYSTSSTLIAPTYLPQHHPPWQSPILHLSQHRLLW